MRDSCIYYVLYKGELERVPCSICWAKMFYLQGKTDGCLYISDFRNVHTSKYVDVICSVINQLTPCEVVTIGGLEFIKFKLFPKLYNKNLILLNFIRYLWYLPPMDKRDARQRTFFRKLSNSEYTDPISILTAANKAMSTDNFYSYGHSNICKYEDLKIQTLETFKAFKWKNDDDGIYVTKEFLKYESKKDLLSRLRVESE